jgi:uncharacterized membrane protein YqgA involved in biofilm formation
MKTPTLIVRLVGLYLIVHNTIALIQVQKINGMGGVGPAQEQIVGDIRIYAVAGLLAGLAAVIFAGPLARILTFDAGRDGRE